MNKLVFVVIFGAAIVVLQCPAQATYLNLTAAPASMEVPKNWMITVSMFRLTPLTAS